MSQPVAEQVAQLYDTSVPDWPGEIDFYRELAAEARSSGAAVLEVACGTGHVAIRLARDGVSVVGIDPAALRVPVRDGTPAGTGGVRGRGLVRGFLPAGATGREYGDLWVVRNRQTKEPYSR
jgi:SAM-dependent methyltransferase